MVMVMGGGKHNIWYKRSTCKRLQGSGRLSVLMNDTEWSERVADGDVEWHGCTRDMRKERRERV